MNNRYINTILTKNSTQMLYFIERIMFEIFIWKMIGAEIYSVPDGV